MTTAATKPATRNGTDPAEQVHFPLNSFKEAATHLRRPFTPAAVKFKVQATWPKDNPTGGLIVSYIDARLVVERLNLIVPHLWFDEYEPVGKGLVCRLTVDGIARQDVGQEQGNVKGLYSDALKRAGVKFGVGVSLYAVPKMMLNVSDGHLKPRKTRDGASLELTPAGEKRVRSIYEGWLTAHGIKAFGEPLDHGDSEDAQGDAEVETGEPSPAPAQTDALASAADVKEMQAAAKDLQPDQVKLALAACGIAGVAAYNKVPAEKVADLTKALAGMERT